MGTAVYSAVAKALLPFSWLFSQQGFVGVFGDRRPIMSSVELAECMTFYPLARGHSPLTKQYLS